MSKRRWISFIVAIAICLTMLSAFSIGAAAEGYPNTYENTGDHRRDIIGVALTQLGYREGVGNDTKYGDWYGLPRNPWCAMFISWCADQAGIPTTVLQKSAIASPAVSCFNITRYSGSQYTPVAGDLFFTQSYSHVGLVYYVEGDYFYSLEGNSNSSGSSEGDGVVSIKRSISNYYYGVPKYTEGYTLTVQYNAGDGMIRGSEKTNDQYKVVSIDGINMRANAGTSYSVVSALPLNTTFIVSETKETDGYTWGKTSYAGKTGWCVISKNWTEKIGMVPCSPYYLDSNGLILESTNGKAKSVVLRTAETNNKLFFDADAFGLEREGKTFVGWATAPFEGHFYPVGSAVTTEKLNGGDMQKSATLVLHAVWMPKSIEIGYHANGGSIISDTYRIKSNLLYKKSAEALYRQKWQVGETKANGLVNAASFGIYKRGYTFMGWGTSKSGGKIFGEDQKLSAEALYAEGCNGSATTTLYAIWAPNTLKVQYHANGGTLNSNTYISKENGIYKKESNSIYLQEWSYNKALPNGLVNDSTFGLKKSGYQFLGWSTAKSGGKIMNMDHVALLPMEIDSRIKEGDHTVTLYAQWVKDNHSHQFKQYHYNDDSTAEKDGTETAECGCGATHTRIKSGTKLQDSSVVFSDVAAKAWYKHYMDYAYTYKIMIGNGKGAMQPQKEMTRAEFVQILASLSGVDTKDRNVETPFTDVKKGAWYVPAVKWAAENDIVSGFGDGTFGPTHPITRQQMCSILVRYTEKYLKINLPKAEQYDLFTDDDQIASWARADVYTCKEAQIISGVSENEFNPKGVATRAAVATMISQFNINYIN